MTEFLVRKFIKNPEQTGRASVRTAYGVLSSMVGIGCNLLLFVMKLLIGLIINSISVVSDAFNNLSDAASSVIGYIGVRMAGRPADKDHPFGHGRIEYIAALIVSFLVIEVGWTFFKTSVGKIRKPEDLSFQAVSLVILCLSIGIKLWLAYFNKKLGKRIGSSVMAATAADSLGDVLVTSATILSVILYGAFGWNIDGYIGLVVSAAVIIGGIGIARDTLKPLIGEAIDPKLYKKIKDFVESYDGIEGTHDLIVHSYGPSNSMASIHAEVDGRADMEAVHDIIDRIEREAKEKLGILLVIHMDPLEYSDPVVRQFRRVILETLQNIDSQITMHDFRMVNGKEVIHVFFDIVVPYERSEEQVEDTILALERALKAYDSRVECAITIDCSYVGEEKNEKN